MHVDVNNVLTICSFTVFSLIHISFIEERLFWVMQHVRSIRYAWSRVPVSGHVGVCMLFDNDAADYRCRVAPNGVDVRQRRFTYRGRIYGSYTYI